MARKEASVRGMRTFVDAMNEAVKGRSARATPKAQPKPAVDPCVYEPALRTDTWRQSLIETLGAVPGLISDDLLKLLIHNPNQIHISIPMFSAFSTDVITKLIDATGHLNEVNEEAFAYVRQTLIHGDLDIISSYFITLTKIIPYHFSDGDKAFKKFARKCLGRIVSQIAKCHLLSVALTNRTEHLSRQKDRILEEFGTSESTDDMNYKSKASKHRLQRIVTQAVPIFVSTSDDDDEVQLSGQPWGSYDWTTRECVIVFILRKAERMLTSWMHHLTMSLKILKNIRLVNVNSIVKLSMESSIDRTVLAKILKLFEEKMAEVFEAGALAHLGFICLSNYRRPLKKVRRNLVRDYRPPILPKSFKALEFYVSENEFLELLEGTPSQRREKLSKFYRTLGESSRPEELKGFVKCPPKNREPRDPTLFPQNSVPLTVLKTSVDFNDSDKFVAGLDCKTIFLISFTQTVELVVQMKRREIL